MAKLKGSIKKSQKKNIVFLPYKASMWDSLESIWKSAFNDKAYCNTYVIPIPYAELNQDGTVKKWHCEINLFPKNVPVVDFRTIDLKKLKPDVTFFHNPYDGYNRVTSVDSNYYSNNLKANSKLLVYVPYYATNGIMSESQSYMPSYDNADYIVIQSEFMKHFFAPMVPEKKFLPFGSPKFDRVIRMSQKSAKVPEQWKRKIAGRKVYFYNTSLGGLLRDTEKFLRKMQYVFETFKGVKNACLLWRPHPLTEATLSSMREEAQIAYKKMKEYFIENDIGIYDDTPDIDNSIAISDVYIGDTKTSVTSLFGVAGKPLFFMNNDINAQPQQDDWRIIIKNFEVEGKDWTIIQGNKLYHAPNHDFNFKYYCELSEYASGNYYQKVLEINGQVYVLPLCSQDILKIKDHKIEKKISLKQVPNHQHKHLFSEVIHIDDKIFIVPNNYPYIVCYNIKTDEVKYISGLKDFFVQGANTNLFRRAYGIFEDQLLLASPNRKAILSLNVNTFQMRMIEVERNAKSGYFSMVTDNNSFWLLPFEGTTIQRLNMKSGMIDTFNNLPEGFQCRKLLRGSLCNERAFSSGICNDEELLLIPHWGNMFVRINKKTGQASEWKTEFKITNEVKSCYLNYLRRGVMNDNYYFDFKNREWYEFNLQTETFEKLNFKFDMEELKAHTSGFARQSEWTPYGCYEGIFNTLKDLIEEKINGQQFNKEIQLKAYEQINASPEGKCGDKVYKFIKDKINRKE